MPSGTEATWAPVNGGYRLYFRRELHFEVSIGADTTTEELEQKLAEARLALTSYSSEEPP